MSVHPDPEFTRRCDTCGHATGADAPTRRAEGWSGWGEQDRCPRCTVAMGKVSGP